MSFFFKIFLISFSAHLFSSLFVSADWREEVGWDMLLLYPDANLPTGSGIQLEMVEAGETAYMPNVNSGAFSGITFTNITNTSSHTSNHATTVALNYYGKSSSFLTGANTVGVRNSNDFLNNFLGLRGSVGTSSAAVMSHAYVGLDNPVQQVSLNEIIKRFDFFSQNSSVINVLGMGNGSSDVIPPIFGSSYNSISVGRSDGLHSHGLTRANYPGPGRQKPEIVSRASSSATSFATGAVSSAASLLYAKAKLANNVDAVHPDTIKASLLAGATKEKFANWSQTTEKPLDTQFGTGQLNIFNSYRIIEKQESSPGKTGFHGWGRNSIGTTGSVTYTFTTPDYKSSLSLSAVLVWQRDVTENTSVDFFFVRPTSYDYQPLANLRLDLLSESGAVIQTSNSDVNNLEHIWNTALTPNTTYTLRVTSVSGAANFSLAWRVNGIPRATIKVEPSGSETKATLNNLIVGTPYIIQRSYNLIDWSNVLIFKGDSDTKVWSDTATSGKNKVFYRLFFFE